MGGESNSCFKFVSDQVNKVTAAVTRDYAASTPLTEPGYCRAITRCLLTLILGGALVAAVIGVAMNQPSTRLRQQEYKSMSEKGPVYPDLPAGPLDGSQNISEMSCNCFRQSFSWTNFITFYLMSLDNHGNRIVEVLNRTDQNKLCTSASARITICQKGLGAILPDDNTEEQRTSIETPTLLPPFLLYTRVLGQIDTSLQTQFFSDYMLDQINNQDNNLYLYSLFIVNLMYTMINQLQRNTTSTHDDYWLASKATFKNLFSNSTPDFSTDFALGMSIQWKDYANLCSPTYCDTIYLYPTRLKVLYAISAVGGFVSIVFFVVQIIIWPIIAKMFDWCTGKNNHEGGTQST